MGPKTSFTTSKQINKNIQERVENWDHEKWRSKTKG